MKKEYSPLKWNSDQSVNKFQNILAFTRVAELGGFTQAARSLGISVSAVTQSINRLEEDLGARLFLRTTRKLRLTDAGIQFNFRCLHILAELDEAEDTIREANLAPKGLVRLSLPPSFGRQTVVPALPRFFARYPSIHLDVHFGHQTLDFIEGGYDLIVHSGTLDDSQLVSRLLVRGPQKTVASPAYLERYGTPKIPQDLREHNCIVGRFGPDWPFHDEQGRPTTIRVQGNLSTDSGDVLREAAVTGLGVSQATWWLFRQELEAGTVVPILEEYAVEADPISIIYPGPRLVPARVRVVVDFFVELTRTAVPDIAR
jgi:DNA-binding transcriptional LysR family regulator